MPKNGSPFEVDRVPSVDEQIKELARRAKNDSVLEAFLDSIKRMLAALRLAPLTWGDPLYHTKKEGGTVYRGIEKLLVVQYVVYEEERFVCVLKIEPLPSAWPS